MHLCTIPGNVVFLESHHYFNVPYPQLNMSRVANVFGKPKVTPFCLTDSGTMKADKGKKSRKSEKQSK